MDRDLAIQLTYLASSVLFILGLRSLTKPDRARRGMQQAAVGMLLAIIGTLIQQDIVRYEWIIGGLIAGCLLGYPLGMWVPMTAMPQRIAFSHMFGALAASLVGIAEFTTSLAAGEVIETTRISALGIEVLFGSLTVTGSFIAFGKLAEFLPGKPITYKGQNIVNGTLFAATLSLLIFVITHPDARLAFFLLVGLSASVGLFLVLPIGGADMPVVISLLNSYAGLAAAATGFAIGNTVLIIAGALDGASGFLLSIIMSRAMNRSFGNILFGAFGSKVTAGAKTASGLAVQEVSVADAALRLAYARLAVVVPGYGMAVAQAQHQVKEVAELIERNGGEVRFAIHPVAGRMPGHMNVLLAEANIPYNELVEMSEINPQFPETDVALIVGANDVVNPAAVNDPDSPIYGMPIIDAYKAKSVIVLKRSMNPGFAGIENELFYMPNTTMLFGDAKASLSSIAAEMKTL